MEYDMSILLKYRKDVLGKDDSDNAGDGFGSGFGGGGGGSGEVSNELSNLYELRICLVSLGGHVKTDKESSVCFAGSGIRALLLAGYGIGNTILWDTGFK